MQIHLRRNSAVSLQQQIAGALSAAIGRGSLRSGHRLQSARELAGELGVNRLTVEGAFARLERSGLIERRQGSGTFVLGNSPVRRDERSGDWPLWQAMLPDLGKTEVLRPREARWDFSTGAGDARLIPAGDFRRALLSVVREEGVRALGYEDPQGFAPLREAIAEVLSSQGLPARASQVLITSGSQQAISLTVRALLRPGDAIVVEEACYDSALSMFRMLGLRVLAAPMDEGGLRLDALESLLRAQRPGLLYCMPNFQNPTGTVLAPERRQALVDLAASYNMPILEDDYVGELRYTGNAPASLKTLDRAGGVLHTSTFSKMLMPGLRLGFVFAEGPVLAHLVAWKRQLELACPSLLQRALHSYVSVGRYRRHVRKARSVYAERCEAMVASLRRHFPKGTRFEVPCGGFFAWVALPEGLSAAELLPKAVEKGVGFADGARFDAAGSGAFSNRIRLNFAASELPDLEEGMRVLGGVVCEELRANGGSRGKGRAR